MQMLDTVLSLPLLAGVSVGGTLVYLLFTVVRREKVARSLPAGRAISPYPKYTPSWAMAKMSARRSLNLAADPLVGIPSQTGQRMATVQG